MKKILVPTDFSKIADHATQFAVHLAKTLNAEVSIVHFTNVPIGDMSLHLTGEAHNDGFSEDALYNAQLFRVNNAKLQACAASFEEEGFPIDARQLGGGFIGGIQHFVEKNEVDLVIIGTTGEENIQEFFSGNHTEQLIEHLNVPVLSVRGEVDANIKDIVIGLDLIEEKYSRPAFNKIKLLTEGLDARLHIVNVTGSNPPATLVGDLNDLAGSIGLENYMVEVIESKNETQGLMDYIKEVDAGMVVTISEARSGLYRFLQHSFSAQLTKVSSVPVVTINKHLN